MACADRGERAESRLSIDLRFVEDIVQKAGPIRPAETCGNPALAVIYCRIHQWCVGSSEVDAIILE